MVHDRHELGTVIDCDGAGRQMSHGYGCMSMLAAPYARQTPFLPSALAIDKPCAHQEPEAHHRAPGQATVQREPFQPLRTKKTRPALIQAGWPSTRAAQKHTRSAWCSGHRQWQGIQCELDIARYKSRGGASPYHRHKREREESTHAACHQPRRTR